MGENNKNDKDVNIQILKTFRIFCVIAAVLLVAVITVGVQNAITNSKKSDQDTGDKTAADTEKAQQKQRQEESGTDVWDQLVEDGVTIVKPNIEVAVRGDADDDIPALCDDYAQKTGKAPLSGVSFMALADWETQAMENIINEDKVAVLVTDTIHTLAFESAEVSEITGDTCPVRIAFPEYLNKGEVGIFYYGLYDYKEKVWYRTQIPMLAQDNVEIVVNPAHNAGEMDGLTTIGFTLKPHQNDDFYDEEE